MSMNTDDRRYMTHEQRVAEGFMAPKADDGTAHAEQRLHDARMAGRAARKAGDKDADLRAREDVAFWLKQLGRD